MRSRDASRRSLGEVALAQLRKGMFALCLSRYWEGVASVQQLPEDLSEVDRATLERATAVRDDRLSPLFRRWPSLSRTELSELKRLYNERLRLAKFLGTRGQS